MQIQKYAKKDKMGGGFQSEDEGGENRTSHRATADEISPSSARHPHQRQTHAKNL